ncbi:MAG: ABC transporter substrate-binding protein [Chloroflexota bacterium]|nr:ABC transporter substrate-binding protein [Chloroflexota bacterium]
MSKMKKYHRIIPVLVIFSLLSGILISCSPSESMATEASVDIEEIIVMTEESEGTSEPEETQETEVVEEPELIEPDDEMVLSMYVAYGGPDIIAEEFEKATGIKVEYLTMSSGEVITRLMAEKANPQTDIWFGGGSDAFIQAVDEGLLEAYKSPYLENVDPAFRDEDGFWTGISLVVVGFLGNTERLADKGLELPLTWADLANSAYLNELMASNPNTSGTAYTMVSGILQMLGEDEGWAFLDEMYANIPYLEKSGSAPGKAALAGEYSLGIVPDPHNLPLNNPNAPLVSVFPEDGVLAWPSPVAIVKGGKHPNNAKIFIDWCLSPEGQKVLMVASPRVPTTDVETIEGVPSLDDLNLIAYDAIYWGTERERVLEEFNQRYPQFR